MRYWTATALAVLLVSAGSGVSETIDDSPEVVSTYARGKRLLRQADWLGAERIFEELAGRFPDSRNLDLFVFNRSKAQYYFGDYDKALAGFGGFVSRFTSSPYRAHARFFAGNIYYSKGNLDRALARYVQAYDLSDDARLSKIVIESISGLVANASTVSLSPADLETLEQSKKCVLIRSLAEILVERKEFLTAKNLLEICGESLDLSDNPDFLERGFDREVQLAIVLPFSGELQAFGDEIYEGAVIAAEIYRKETGGTISLEPYDTEGDPVSAARIVKALAGSSLDAVIGPLTSDEAAVASAVLACSDLPMITPAATQAGLTLLSQSSFQLSPNIELQAVRMAEYAIMNLHADSAAIITSTTSENLQMSRAFAVRFGELGGTIVAIEYYRPRDRDFGPYIRDIKTAVLGMNPESVYFVNDDGDTLDADVIPAYIDCLYLPGSPSQLRLLLPQIRFYNLNTVYVGSDGWGDEAVLGLGDEITKQAVFPSPFLLWTAGDEYQQFAEAYDTRYGRQPQRLAEIGRAHV